MPEIHTVHTTGLYYPDCFLTIRKRIKESKMLLHCTCYFNSLKSPEYSQQTRFVFSKPSLILRSQGWQECIPQMRFACFLQGEWRNIKSGAYPLTLNEALTSLRPQDVCVWAFQPDYVYTLYTSMPWQLQKAASSRKNHRMSTRLSLKRLVLNVLHEYVKI